MAYDVQAVIVGDGLLRTAARGVSGARPAALRQGLALLPMTDEVCAAVSDGGPEGALGFWRLPGGCEALGLDSHRFTADWVAAGGC